MQISGLESPALHSRLVCLRGCGSWFIVSLCLGCGYVTIVAGLVFLKILYTDRTLSQLEILSLQINILFYTFELYWSKTDQLLTVWIGILGILYNLSWGGSLHSYVLELRRVHVLLVFVYLTDHSSTFIIWLFAVARLTKSRTHIWEGHLLRLLVSIMFLSDQKLILFLA